MKYEFDEKTSLDLAEFADFQKRLARLDWMRVSAIDEYFEFISGDLVTEFHDKACKKFKNLLRPKMWRAFKECVSNVMEHVRDESEDYYVENFLDIRLNAEGLDLDERENLVNDLNARLFAARADIVNILTVHKEVPVRMNRPSKILKTDVPRL